MNTTNGEFDFVIKIDKIDEYRLRPKRSAQVSGIYNAIPNSITTHDVVKPKFEGMCGRIYTVVAKSKSGIKAKDIANELRLTRKEVNHCLYGSLSKYVIVDDSFKWHAIEPMAAPTASLSTSKTKKRFENKSFVEQGPINFDVLKTKAMLPYIEMFDNLHVSHRKGLNAPHKYILLISVFTLIGRGIIHSNRFGSTKEIEETFNETWKRFVPKGTPFNSMYTTPFWHLASERFWNLYTIDNKLVVDIWKKPMISIKKQRKELTALIDINLYNLMLNDDVRRATIAYLGQIVLNGLKEEYLPCSLVSHGKPHID